MTQPIHIFTLTPPSLIRYESASLSFTDAVHDVLWEWIADADISPVVWRPILKVLAHMQSMRGKEPAIIIVVNGVELTYTTQETSNV